MTRIIYIEQEVVEHPRVLEICARFPKAEKIVCERYGEVFNKRAQNFRMQKQSPALILAKKFGKRVLPAPAGYGIGRGNSFYFSHMMNCVYDCRYCFLQGMYRSAYYVLFVNYEDFVQDIYATADLYPEQDNYFFSGYDCDSLAYEPVSKFVENILPAFAERTNCYLELRTKSTQIRGLLNTAPQKNCIVAFSLSPQNVVETLEHKTPGLDKRLDAMAKLQRAGWPIGLRFDPIVYRADYKSAYRVLFDQVFSVVDPGKIHSISFGMFRLPESYFSSIAQLYPDERLFANPFQIENGMVSYGKSIEAEVMAFCNEQLSAYVSGNTLFACQNDE